MACSSISRGLKALGAASLVPQSPGIGPVGRARFDAEHGQLLHRGLGLVARVEDVDRQVML